MSTEGLERLQQCCDAYGGDPARWPPALRRELAGLADSVAGADICADAQMLDGFLNASTAPRMAEDLPRRLLADFDAAPNSRTITDSIVSFAAAIRRARFRLAPIGVLAGMGVIGLASGIVTASAQTPLTPESEALAYMEDGLAFSALDEEEALVWDAD